MTAQGPGEALQHAHAGSLCDVGMCLRYVRTWWEVASLYGSAIEAWNGARFKHPGDRNPPDGAPAFYRGGQYGHIVITDRKHEGMRSTDCPQSGHIADSDIGWIERTWGYEYLGWTEDLNGVNLPLGGDEMNQDDWDRLRKIVREEVQAAWEKKIDVEKPDGSDTVKAREQILRETLQRVQK